MPQSQTTTYLQIESVGADKLIASMVSLQKSMNFAAAMLKDLNKGLGLVEPKVRKGDAALKDQAKTATEAMQAANQLRVAMLAQNQATTQLTENVTKLAKAQEEHAKKKGIDWTALRSKVELVKQGYELVKNALVTVGQETMRVSQAWEVQAQAEERLTAAMRSSGMGENITAMKEWASALQSATTYGDEQVLSLASQAAKFAGSEEATRKATKAALDWASATGGDAAQAISTMGRAIQGNGQSLRQLGIYLTENEQAQFKNIDAAERMEVIISKLSKQYAGFSEELAKTPIGVLTQCQNILGDIDEEVGKLVSPALYAGLSVVKDYLIGQQEELGKITGDARNLQGIQYTIIDALSSVYDYCLDIQSVLVMWKNSIEIFVEALAVGFTAALKPVGLLVEALGKLPGLSDEMRTKFADVGQVISKPFDMAVRGIKNDVADITSQINDAEKRKNAVRKSLQQGFETYSTRPTMQGTGDKSPGAGALSKTKKEQEEESISFKMELDSRTQAELKYEEERLAIMSDFAEKRKALEQSTLIDYQTKQDYKKDLDTQEQEQLAALKLQLARETGDQLALLEDQYRQERLAKEKEAEEQLRAEQQATMEKLASNITGVTDLGVDMLTSWIEGTGDWRAQLYDAMKSFSVNLMKNSIASIIDQALVNQAKAQGSQAAIPIVGPALALVAGAAMFATTMALKSKLKPAEVKYAQGGYISAGMVKGGTYGRDSVHALLEPGERVLSKKETEAYDARQSAQDVTINLTVSGNMSTPEQVRDTVRRVLIPEINTALRGGYRLAV